MLSSEKTNAPIPRKRKEDGRTDGQTLSYRTLPPEVGGPKTQDFDLELRSKNGPCWAKKIFLQKIRYSQLYFLIV